MPETKLIIFDVYVGSLVFVSILALISVGMLCVHFVKTNKII